MASLHRRMVRLHTHSLTYHVFARAVSPLSSLQFRLPECPPMEQLKIPVFKIQDGGYPPF